MRRGIVPVDVIDLDRRRAECGLISSHERDEGPGEVTVIVRTTGTAQREAFVRRAVGSIRRQSVVAPYIPIVCNSAAPGQDEAQAIPFLSAALQRA